MDNKERRITGRMIDQTGQGVEGLRIEAWDKPGRVHSMHHKHLELALMSINRYHFV